MQMQGQERERQVERVASAPRPRELLRDAERWTRFVCLVKMCALAVFSSEGIFLSPHLGHDDDCRTAAGSCQPESSI